jgi:membrane associated rhomboid family serine protease
MKIIHYNSPVILTFAIVAVIVYLVSVFLFPGLTPYFFRVGPSFSFSDPLDYFRLVSYVMGHASFDHLFNNLVLILLLGPILEERYGSSTILGMMFVTALCTGIINVLFFPTGLLGASGIVFMFVILVSIVNMKSGSIPLTFLLVSFIFIGRELVQVLREDNISQMAHIVGGSIGAVFGFRLAKPSD